MPCKDGGHAALRVAKEPVRQRLARRDRGRAALGAAVPVRLCAGARTGDAQRANTCIGVSSTTTLSSTAAALPSTATVPITPAAASAALAATASDSVAAAAAATADSVAAATAAAADSVAAAAAAAPSLL